jgi:hypothetical protein
MGADNQQGGEGFGNRFAEMNWQVLVPGG